MTLVDVSLPIPVFAQVQNLNLAWDPSDSPEIDHYNVYVGTASGAHDVAVTPVPASQTTYPFPATAGVLYYFAVSAVTKEGVESVLSQEISGSVPLLSSLPARTSVVDREITAVHVSAVDPDGGVLRFSHTGLPLGLVLDPVTGIIIGIPTTTGTYDVTIFVSDGVVTSSQTFAWTIRSPGSADTTAPSLSITSHTSGQSVTSSTITLSGTATDSGLGESGITRVTVNGLTATGGSASGSDTANWSRSITLSGSTNTVLVEALDGGGNYSAELITLTRDTNSPSVTITSHTSGQTVTTSTITVSGTASDAGTGGNGISSIMVNGSTVSGGTSSGSSTASWSRSVTLSLGSNVVTVVATDGAGNSRSAAIAINYTPGPLAITSLTSSLASPQTPGSVIRFNATASGGTAPYQYKWWVLSDGVWTVAQGWSASATLNWQPTTAGSYVVAVWGRNAGVTADASQALAQVPYVISDSIGGSYAPNASPASLTQLTLSSLTSDLASPQVPGTTVTFSATTSGGTAPYQYKWWVLGGGVWTVAQEWSNSATLWWRPTTAGTYTVAVWARNAGVTADASQAMAQVPYVISGSSAPVLTLSPSPTPLTLSSLTSDLASPQVLGTTVTFSAAASGGTAPYQYKWWVSDGTSWSVARDWSASASMTWRPTTAGPYSVSVWARNAGVTADASQAALTYVSYFVSGSGSSAPVSTPNPTPNPSPTILAPLTISSLTSNLASPQVAGTTVTFSAAASGGTAPYQYKWWVSNGTSWSVARDWNTSASMAWQPTTAGPYSVAVWARNAGVTADANQAMAYVTYDVSGSSAPVSTTSPNSAQLTLSSLTSHLASPQLAGTTITFTTGASGGAAPYQYKWWVQSGGEWTVAQEWSSSASLWWKPATAGTYVVAVWARNAGVTADASQALAHTTYVIAPPDGGLPPSVTSLTSNTTNPTSTGTSIRFTTSASGGTGSYQFKWWVFDGASWSVAQNWGTSASMTWRPETSGAYMVAVWVRNAGVTADASQGLAQMSYVITP